MHRTRRRGPGFVGVLLIVTLAMVGTAFSVRTEASAAAPVRIMPLGDSITGPYGCWRALLWRHLQSAGHTTIDFVGTQNSHQCAGDYDADNEGHSGFRATDIAQSYQLAGWLGATNPDIVMMMLGTNDVWAGIDTPTILDAYTQLLFQMRVSNPDIKLIMAQIPPMNPSNCPECAQRVVDLNRAIPQWVAQHSTAQSPITLVDQFSGFDMNTDTVDGVHPNDSSGTPKLESRWYPALAGALSEAGAG